jgi:hypothetical protein
MTSLESDTGLLAEYIATFEKLDDLSGTEFPPSLVVSTDEYGWQEWKPRQITTGSWALKLLYQGLGLRGIGSTRFPPLYETLLLSYRWAKVDLGSYRLLANEPAEDFARLLADMRSDTCLHANLVSNGYFQFGQGPDYDYDPVCFDFRQRQQNGDCRIVKIDHEDILCNGRVREAAELAPNFRSLVLDTIARST